jgi:predicted  nucleic acid-binding Zn-ribbon protein
MDELIRRELDQHDRRLMAVEIFPAKVATLEVELDGVQASVTRVEVEVRAVHDRISILRDDLVEGQKAELERRAQSRKEELEERRRTFRWALGAGVACAMMLFAAFGLVLQVVNAA